MSEKIYYNRTAAEHFGSVVAAILITCVVKKCEENNADTIEEVDEVFYLHSLFADILTKIANVLTHKLTFVFYLF